MLMDKPNYYIPRRNMRPDRFDGEVNNDPSVTDPSTYRSLSDIVLSVSQGRGTGLMDTNWTDDEDDDDIDIEMMDNTERESYRQYLDIKSKSKPLEPKVNPAQSTDAEASTGPSGSSTDNPATAQVADT